MRSPAVLMFAVALSLTGCATAVHPIGMPVVDAPSGSASAEGEVLGQGTVLQVEPDAAQLCLGGVMESFPPQCSGPEIVGWDWAEVEYEESASGVTWGSYAVQGTWDGQIFTLTQPPIPLALYDPMANVDPRQDPQNAGATDEDRLLEIQEQLGNSDALELLTSVPTNGYLWLTVTYDDGSLQDYVDDVYGADVVIVQSALRSVG